VGRGGAGSYELVAARVARTESDAGAWGSSKCTTTGDIISSEV
jgi:hypothetical protein